MTKLQNSIEQFWHGSLSSYNAHLPPLLPLLTFSTIGEEEETLVCLIHFIASFPLNPNPTKTATQQNPKIQSLSPLLHSLIKAIRKKPKPKPPKSNSLLNSFPNNKHRTQNPKNPKNPKIFFQFVLLVLLLHPLKLPPLKPFKNSSPPPSAPTKLSTTRSNGCGKILRFEAKIEINSSTNFVDLSDPYLLLLFLAQIIGFWIWVLCENKPEGVKIGDFDEQLKLWRERVVSRNGLKMRLFSKWRNWGLNWRVFCIVSFWVSFWTWMGGKRKRKQKQTLYCT